MLDDMEEEEEDVSEEQVTAGRKGGNSWKSAQNGVVEGDEFGSKGKGEPLTLVIAGSRSRSTQE